MKRCPGHLMNSELKMQVKLKKIQSGGKKYEHDKRIESKTDFTKKKKKEPPAGLA